MAFDLDHLDSALLEFARQRYLGALSTVSADGRPHVVPVGFAFDPVDRLVRIITQRASVKARHASLGGPAAVMQVDGGRWLTFEGRTSLVTDPERVARAVAAYTERYQAPRSARAESRVAIEIAVQRIIGRC
jgi:PPOX class probable F420-dependent enzyme